MAFNGAGVFARLYNWVSDAAASINITASRMDAEMDGMANGLSTCLTKDGQTTPTANLPMGTFRHTGVGDSSSLTSYPSTKQAQNGSLTYAVDSGSANAYIITLSPAPSTYLAGMDVYIKITNANTGASTINVNSLGVKNIKTHLGADPLASAMGAGQIVHLKYNGTNFEILTEGNAVHTVGDESISGSKSLTGVINEAKGANIASVAGTTDIWTPADGNTVHITGTNATDSFGTAPQAGSIRHCIADGASSIVHGANLVCPGGANITCEANDAWDVYADTTTKMYVLNYTRANGTALVSKAPNIQTFTTAGADTWTKPTGYSSGAKVLLEAFGAGASGALATGANLRACGGGGGSYKYKWTTLGALGATENVTVGAGGAARVSDGDGNNGGSSSFGTLLTAYGGAGGGFNNAGTAEVGGAAGGLLAVGTAGAKNNDLTWGEGWGGDGAADQNGAHGFNTGGGGAGVTAAGVRGVGGSSLNGGGGGGAATAAGGTAGGTSTNGGAGAAGATAAAGTQPGGGGGAGVGGATNSGAGADGMVRVTVFPG